MSEYLIGVYKEVGKNPDLKKIKNTKEDLEQLVGGEMETVKYEDYVIVYKKKSGNLLGNICLDAKGYGLGLTLRGTIFAINQDEDGNFKSLNKKQALDSTGVFIQKQFNYKNFDEKGRYLSKSQRKKKAMLENKKRDFVKSENQDINVGNDFFEKNFRLERIDNKEKNYLNSNENDDLQKKNEIITNNTSDKNNKGKLILERTIDSNTSTESNNMDSPSINLSDETVLKMILKIQLIILDFLKNANDESDE